MAGELEAARLRLTALVGRYVTGDSEQATAARGLIMSAAEDYALAMAGIPRRRGDLTVAQAREGIADSDRRVRLLMRRSRALRKFLGGAQELADLAGMGKGNGND